MGYFQINNLFQEIKKLQGDYNQKHFIITNKRLDSALDFLTPMYINDYPEIEEIIDDLITLKDKHNISESDEVKRLKEQLEEANNRIESLEKTSNKDKLLEREALKYFRKGVSFSLSKEYLKAIVEYKVAVELKYDFHEAYYNWGTALLELTQIKEDKESEDLFKESFEKYKKAIEFKHDKHEAYNNWGIALSNLAEIKEGKESENLFKKAIDKYKKSIEFKHDKHEAYYNWGTVLSGLAKIKEGRESEVLFEQSFEKLEKALEYGGQSYNLSCNYALKGNKENALKYLEISLSKKEIKSSFVLKDEDWQTFLEDEDFITLIKKHS